MMNSTGRQWGMALLLFLLPLSLLAATKLTGTITDAESGDPLVGVNVVVKGTYRGAATDFNGRYLIMGMPEGSVDLEMSQLGYRTVLATGLVVLNGIFEDHDFALERSYIQGEDVVIVGKKPLFEIDNTSSSTVLDFEELQTQVVEDITDVVGQQVGVTKTDNEIHIRGGRADENLYIIDGMSVKDPVSGQGTGVYLSAEAIKSVEVITGGFNAEYGEAMSGVINVETREGEDEFFGSFNWKRDNLGDAISMPNENEDVLEFSMGGPLPKVLPGTMSWFLNAYGSASDTHLPHADELHPYKEWMKPFAQREENNASALFKVVWRPKMTRKLVASVGRSLRVNQGYFAPLVEDKRYYPYAYQENLDNYNTFTQESRQVGLNWKESLSEKSYFDINYGLFYINQHADVAGKHWTEYERPLDIDPTWYLMNPEGDITIYQGDGFWDFGDTDFWHDHYALTHSLKASWTRQWADHELKTGLDIENSELQLLHITAPWLGNAESPGRSFDSYHLWTTAGAMYVQDKISYKGMNANIGLRLDFWRPGSYVEDVVEDPDTAVLTDAARELFYDETFAAFGGRWKAQLSPRFGISHPITDNDMLFFSYGHFSQRPKYAYVYAKLKTSSQGSYQLFGNPNLNPTTTVAYEVGVKHRFDSNSVLQLTAFYKDMFNYVTAFRVSSKHPRYGNISYTQYWNIDYARSRGLELSWRHRFPEYWSFTWNLSYSVLTGKSSSPAENLLNQASVGNRDTDLGESYLSWDKPLTTSANVSAYIGRGKAPVLLGYRLPEQMGFNLRLEFETGQRYSPQVIDTGDPQNPYDDEAKRANSKPYTDFAAMRKMIDLKVYKDFDLPLGMDCRTFCEVQNLFDFKLAASSKWINPLTGEVWEEGDPFVANNRVYYEWSEELSRERVRPPGTPTRYKAPRQLVFGLSVRF
jgi:outer membrane receptor protein involved in Fe transport